MMDKYREMMIPQPDTEVDPIAKIDELLKSASLKDIKAGLIELKTMLAPGDSESESEDSQEGQEE